VVDSGTPQQSDQQSLSLTITQTSPPPACGVGVTNCLTVSNAPASVGGTFVVDPQLTRANSPGSGVYSFSWWESTTGQPFEWEYLAFVLNTDTKAHSAIFQVNRDISAVFSCVSFSSVRCDGLIVNREDGTATFTNVVMLNPLDDKSITLNGTLRFTPF
jgi:hypothetical protein